MATNGKNYTMVNMGKYADLSTKEGAKGRFMLGEALGLTGCEVSVNSAMPGKFAPFVHAHKMNEEVYIVISGKGEFHLDGEEFPIEEGSMIRVAPEGKRAIRALEPMLFLCIQANQGSLVQSTHEDGVICEEKASWM